MPSGPEVDVHVEIGEMAQGICSFMADGSTHAIVYLEPQPPGASRRGCQRVQLDDLCHRAARNRSHCAARD